MRTRFIRERLRLAARNQPRVDVSCRARVDGRQGLALAIECIKLQVELRIEGAEAMGDHTASALGNEEPKPGHKSIAAGSARAFKPQQSERETIFGGFL